MNRALLRTFSLALSLSFLCLTLPVGELSYAQDTLFDPTRPPRNHAPTAPQDASVEPESGPPRILEWPGQIGDQIAKSKYSAGNNISNMIWKRVSTIKFLKNTRGWLSPSIDVARQVFDNHDISNSYTVVDFFNFRTGIPLFSKSLASAATLAGQVTANFGVTLGTAEGIELMDIRQVNIGGLARIPSVPALKNKITEAPPAADPDLPSPDEPILSEKDPAAAEAQGSLSFLDPLRKARYRDFWNIFTFPVRIPFHPDSLKKLESGEVISYNIYGAVQVGASVGWGGQIPSVFRVFDGSLSYSAYIRGDYRVSVLKEDERYARVKVTRTYTHGNNGGLNARGKTDDWFSGFLIFGRRHDPKAFTIVPFRIQVDKSNAEAFDVGYRYDLTQPAAREAYKLAMLGRFAYSDELSQAPQGAPQVSGDPDKGAGVEKVFTRNQKIATDTLSTGLNIASFFRRDDSATYSDWDAIVTLPEGTRRIVSTDTQNIREWEGIFGTYERATYTFRVNSDVDSFNAGKDDSIYLVAEGNIEDSNTFGKELYEYETLTEEAVGERDLFPRLPIYRPLTEREQDERDRAQYEPSLITPTHPEAPYGFANFYFRLMFTQAQIEKFINYPEEKMWEALEKAFAVEPGSWSTKQARLNYQIVHTTGVIANIPLYLFNVEFYESPKLYHAQIVHSQWLNLRNQQTINDRTKALGKIFKDRTYGHELSILLRAALEGEEIAYTVSGINRGFGRIYKQGNSEGHFFSLPDRIRKEIDYDQPETHALGDDRAKVTSLQLTSIPQGHKLEFSAAEKPRSVYIRVTEDGSWYSNALLGEWVIGDGGYLKEGDNTLYLTPDSPEPWNEIARILEKGKQYSVSLAISADGQNWGPLTTVRYFAKTLR